MEFTCKRHGDKLSSKRYYNYAGSQGYLTTFYCRHDIYKGGPACRTSFELTDEELQEHTGG